MIADIAFDVPLAHPFSYQIPSGWTLRAGQRVQAPLRSGLRVGLVLRVRDGAADGLKPLAAIVDPRPMVSASALDLVEWIAAQSFSSAGSTVASLLPPADGAHGATPALPDPEPVPGSRLTSRTELLTGIGREGTLLERIAAGSSSALLVVPDLDAAARWTQRLSKIDRVVRLDSGVGDGERAAGWRELCAGRARLAVGTRSALLVPLGPSPTLALVDEHEPAHRPPGHPRMHSREILLERARREAARVVMTSATPSAESWLGASRGVIPAASGHRGAWPAVSIADTRGILRREPLMPELARALRETLGAGERAFLGVNRFASALACDECGLVIRCVACGVALTYSRAATRLQCRLCGAVVGLPDTCPGCTGRRLSPFGWGVERVEHAVRRRFPHARIARYDPDARGKRRSASAAEASAADVVIGTRGALRLFGRASLGLAALVSPDQLLRVPDFRAGERLFALLWAAAERVKAGGQLIVQSQNPTHHAVTAVMAQDLGQFYGPELAFREELGYPPFRRIAVVTVRPGRSRPIGIVDAVGAALRGSPRLTVYAASPDHRRLSYRFVVKGDDDLPDLLRQGLGELLRGRGIIGVEVDPIEWQC
jgi:primosomal protein N'